MLPTIINECSQFLVESGGLPLLKNLPKNKNGFIKVKVRHQKANCPFIKVFNDAFADERTNLLQRSIIAHGENGFQSNNAELEPFYVFPIDGYRYMYNPTASTRDYIESFNSLMEKLGDMGGDILKDVLKRDYEFDNLQRGISSGSEIIIYGIPYYYALRKSLVDDYERFLFT